VKYPIDPDLAQTDKPRTTQMFAQQHTEHGRGLRVLWGLLDKMKTRVLRPAAEQQLVCTPMPAKVKNKLVSAGLGDFLYPAAKGFLGYLVF